MYVYTGRFYTTVALSVWANLGKHLVVRMVLRLKYKDGHKTHYASGRIIIRLERRTSKGSSSERIMRLVPVFILETHHQTNYKMFAQVRPDRSCDCSIKTAIPFVYFFCLLRSLFSGRSLHWKRGKTSGPVKEALMNDVLGHERSGEATPSPWGGGGGIERLGGWGGEQRRKR